MKRFIPVLLFVFLYAVLPASSRTDSVEPPLSEKLPVRKDDTAAIRQLLDLYYGARVGDPLKALSYLQSAQSIAEKGKLIPQTGNILYHKGYLYRTLGINHLALESYMKSLRLFEAEKDSNLVAWLLLDIGNLYFNQKTNPRMAMEHYQKAASLFELLGNKNGLMVATNNMGLTYRDEGDYTSAIRSFNKAGRLSEERKDSEGHALSLSYIGQTYLLEKRFGEAKTYFDSSYAINKKYNLTEGMGDSFDNYADMDEARGNHEAAIKNYETSLSYYRQLKDEVNISLLLKKISLVYSHQGNYPKALEHALSALAVADSNKIVAAEGDLLPLISDYYFKLHDTDRALDYLRRYQALKESDLTRKLEQTQAEYEAEAKRQEMELLEREKELRDSQIRHQKVLLYLISAGLLLVSSLLVIILVRSRQLKQSNRYLFKTNVDIVKKEEELVAIRHTGRYSTSPLSAESNQALLDELTRAMQEEKMYLSSGLTVDDLAKKLNTNRTYLSQVINESFRMNFNNFINEYRIKEAQRLLLDENSRTYTIEAIANTVGFTSKSSFNAAFKKLTGLTPSQFIKMKNEDKPLS